MKTHLKKHIRIPLLFMMAAIIIAAVYGYTHSTGERLKKQAYYALEQNVGEIANQIEASVNFAKSSIQLVAQSATQKMDSEVISDVNAILDPLLDSTPFNFIEYILADGWNTMNDGGTPFDASDREYYKQGIQGITGIWINYTPKKSEEPLLNFYTPLYYEGEIHGVFTGTLGGDSDMKPLLSSTFFGEEVLGILCDSDGYVITSTVDDLAANTAVRTYLTETMRVSNETFALFLEHVSREDRTAFEFRENEGTAIGCISRMEDLGWYVIQIVPARSLKNITNTTAIQSVLVIGLILLLFIGYSLYIGREQKKQTAQEIAEHRGVIEVLGREYSCVYLVNTQTRYVEPFRMTDEMTQFFREDLKKDLLWDDAVANYASRFIRDEHKADFLWKCSLDNLMTELQKDGDIYTYEYIKNCDGEPRVFRGMASFLPYNKVRHIVLGFADINEDRENERATQQALQDACRRAEAANEAKSAFLLNMSHDIRTPMNAIIGFTNIAMKQNTNETVAGCLEKVASSSEHLLALINDVLDISRVESGKVIYTPAPTDLCEVTETVLAITQGFLTSRHLNFRVERPAEKGHCWVLADPIRIREVLVNILGNAVKYTDDGGVITFSMSRRPGADDRHIVVRFTVADTGRGMNEEFLPHVFDEFSQEESGARTQYKGTGLGMAITKRYVDMMGGTIQVASKKDVGTTFTVEIPLELTEEQSPSRQDPPDAPVNLEGVRVLLAEDNDLNADIATIQLEESGMIITRVTDGVQAVNAFSRNPQGSFDVILMDIMMPEMDGYTATKAIRAMETRPDGRTIPIIAMTASAFAEDIQAALDAGMNGHISKPIMMDVLLRTIARNLNR